MPTRKKYSKEFKIDAVRKMSIILRHKPFEFSVATLHECRLVNPYRFGQFGCRRRFFHKALRMLLIGGIQHFLYLSYFSCPPVVNHFRWIKGNPGMTVLLVVPFEKSSAKSPGIFYAPKALRKFRTVFQRLKLGFRIGIVIARMRPAVALCHAKIR